MAMHEVKERLYYTRDKSRVVPEGDPEAAFLFATPGVAVPMEEAERVGLTGKAPQAAAPQVVYSTVAPPTPETEEAPAKAPAKAEPPAEDEDADEDAAAPDTKARHTAPEDKAMSAPRRGH